MTSRDLRVLRVVNAAVDRYVYRLPVDPFLIARACGARFVTLSRWEAETGGGPDGVFALWGNPDGVLIVSDGFWSIHYNERQPENRIRFTVAEELMHYLLGHLSDRRFNIAAQDYDDATYARCEEEAKHAAAMLLVPPSLYFRYRRRYSPAQLARLCRVSEACLRAAARYYEDNEALLRERFTHKHIECDTRLLVPLNPLRPISVWPQCGML